MRVVRLSARALLLSVVVAASASNVVRAQSTATRGGTGGTSYNQNCPTGHVLTGLKVQYGQWLDQIIGKCRAVKIRTGETSGLVLLTQVGKPHAFNSTKEIDCPTNYAVKSFKGTAGSYVHSLVLICKKLEASGRTGPTSASEISVGPSGTGTAFGSIACDEAKPAKGIQGKAGEYIDSFGLRCGYIMPSAVVLLTPANGAEVTMKVPLFSWDPISFLNKDIRLCMNLSVGATCSISGTYRRGFGWSTTDWRPSTDLPFARGDVVYWRIEACNDNGCTSASRSFRFMP